LEIIQLRHWQVLLIDDDEDDYLLTRQMLNQAKGRKITLVWASNYQDGLLEIQQTFYDAVLVDYDLGSNNGINLIREAISNRCRSPLILYTSRGSYEIDVEAMEAGATLYLTKSDANPLLLERFIRYAIERKKTEQERLDILESIQDGFFTLDQDWRITYINRRAAEISAKEPQELIGKNIWEMHPLLLGTHLEQSYRKVMEERVSVKFEMKGIYNGPWFAISVYPFVDGISVYWQDITEKKKTEDELRDREARYRVAATNFPAVYTQTDHELRYRWIHSPHPDFDASEVIGKRDDELEDNEYTRKLMALKQKVLESGLGLREEISFLRSDGLLTYDIFIEPYYDDRGNIAGVTTAALDITGRRMMEEALRKWEEMLSLALSVTGAGAWSWDLKKNTYEWSDSCYHLLGLESGSIEPTENALFDRLVKDDAPSFKAAIENAVGNGTQVDIECRVILSESSIRWIRVLARTIFSKEGLPVQVSGIVIDITDQKQVGVVH
jgi:PAS domain S-box-containing protein